MSLSLAWLLKKEKKKKKRKKKPRKNPVLVSKVRLHYKLLNNFRLKMFVRDVAKRTSHTLCLNGILQKNRDLTTF